MPLFVDLLMVYPLRMPMHESQRKGTSLFLRPYNAKIYISRLSVTTQKSRTPPRSAAAAGVPWQRRSWPSWTLLIASKRTEPKMIWVNFR